MNTLKSPSQPEAPNRRAHLEPSPQSKRAVASFQRLTKTPPTHGQLIIGQLHRTLDNPLHITNHMAIRLQCNKR